MIYITVFVISIILVMYCQKHKLGQWCYLLSIAPIVLLAALRDPSIGTDTSAYVTSVFRYAKSSYRLPSLLSGIDLEPGYILLNYLVSRFTHYFWAYLFVAHFIMYGCVVYALYKLRNELFVWMGIGILLFVCYRESLNTARQSIALYIDVLAFVYLLRSKYIPAIGLCALGFNFHHSNIIFALVIALHYFVNRFPELFSYGKTKFLLIVSIALFLFYLSSALSFLGEFDDVIQEKYIARYGTSERYGSGLPLSVLAINTFNLIMFYMIKRKCYKNIGKSTIMTFYEYLLIFSFTLTFSGFVSTFATRMVGYFSYMNIIIFPWLYYKKQNLYDLAKIHIMFFVFYWFMTVVVANLGGTYPYMMTKEFTL